MRARAVVVGTVTTEKPAQMGFAENREVIQALATDGADHSFHEWVLQSRQLQLMR